MLERPPIPLHEQVRNILTHEIESGVYAESGRLPVETELGERFGVSRITIRRAVGELEAEGLVQRKQGKGTFVRPRRTTTATLSLGGFSDQFLVGKIQPERVILLAETLPADADVAERLGIAAGADVFHLVRLLCTEGLPLALDDCHYALERFPGFDAMIDDSTSTYHVLRSSFGVRFKTVRREISVTYASEATAVALHRPENDPLVLIDKTVLDEAGVVVHTSRLECVPARMNLSIITTAE